MMEHPGMIEMAKYHNVTFDLGMSSNYLTGVWSDRTKHPVNVMLANDLRVTLGTDDPVQCGSTLDDEFELTKRFGVTDDQRRHMRKIAEENTNRYVRAT
jgi:adenosine deaminase